MGFCHLVAGFTDRHLVDRVGALIGEPYTSRQATYDLRRLKRKRLIHKVPRSHRYHLTDVGRSVSVLFTKTYGRMLSPGLTALDLRVPAEISSRSSLAKTWRQLEQALDQFIDGALIAGSLGREEGSEGKGSEAGESLISFRRRSRKVSRAGID